MSNALALLQLSRALHAAASFDAALDRVRESLAANTRYDRAFVHLFAPDARTFEMVGWVASDQERIRQRLATIDVSQDRLLQRGFAATEPFVIPDLRSDADADQAQVEYFGNRTIICVPMFIGDERVGPFIVPTFADQGVLVPTEEEFDFIVQVGSLLALVIGRLRAEEARRAVEDQVAAADRLGALGRMAGEVAHDFNNVLVTILANTELALMDATQPAQRACLEDVRSAAERASAYSRELLATARGQVLVREPVEVPALLERVERLLRPTMPAGAMLQRTVGDGFQPVAGDAAQLERVLLNLLVNARDAIDPSGRIDLDASVVTLDGDSVGVDESLAHGRYAVIAVADTGRGIAPEVLGRIFEPYFTTNPGRGSGIGLSVVDGIVRQHGGAVRVTSQLGVGTTFRVFLPLRDEAIATDSHVPLRISSLPAGVRVIVVDDDAQVRRTVERILVPVSQVVVCADATTALAAIESADVDLLITDVVLPGGDGVELARLARLRRTSLAVLFITGHSRGKLDGMALPVLAKPFSPSALLQAATAALGARGASARPIVAG